MKTTHPIDPELLMSKEPWSTPSPVSYGRRHPGVPEPSCEFPQGYSAGYDLPGPLPDSPPLRWHGTYKGKGKSRLITAAQGDDEMEGGPVSPDRQDPTNEERLDQARGLYEQERQRADRLQQELEALRLGQRPRLRPTQTKRTTHTLVLHPMPRRLQGPPPRRDPSGTYENDHPPPMSGVKTAAHGEASVLRRRP